MSRYEQGKVKGPRFFVEDGEDGRRRVFWEDASGTVEVATEQADGAFWIAAGHPVDFRAIADAIDAEDEARSSYQDRVGEWLRTCFAPEVCEDLQERCDRFLEEAIGFCQSLDHGRARAHALVEYVYGRPMGEQEQELGGVMVTLAALCSITPLDMEWAAEAELARVWLQIEKIREKQTRKPTGSALPVPPRDKERTENE